MTYIKQVREYCENHKGTIIDVSKVKIVDDLVFSCNYKDFEHKNTHELCIGINYICTPLEKSGF